MFQNLLNFSKDFEDFPQILYDYFKTLIQKHFLWASRVSEVLVGVGEVSVGCW